MSTLKDRILESALDILMQKGLKGWTMGDTAIVAKVSKGLIHYHFRSRDEFLGEIYKTADLRRTDDMIDALTEKSGTAALDDLWHVIEDQVTNGLFGTWLDLSRELSITDADRPEWYGRLTWEISQALKIDETILQPASKFIGPAIDGFQLQLLHGTPHSVVRDGFDRMWAAALAN